MCLVEILSIGHRFRTERCITGRSFLCVQIEATDSEQRCGYRQLILQLVLSCSGPHSVDDNIDLHKENERIKFNNALRPVNLSGISIDDYWILEQLHSRIYSITRINNPYHTCKSRQNGNQNGA